MERRPPGGGILTERHLVAWGVAGVRANVA